MKLTSIKPLFRITILLFVLFAALVNITAQQPRKQRVDTFGITLRAEVKKNLYPTVDSLSTKEFAVFVLLPHGEANASLRMIERNSKTFIEIRSLHKNVGAEVFTAFINHNYKQIVIQSDSFTVEVTESFKNKMLEAFRKTVHQKFIEMTPKKYIEFYDGTNFDFWLNEGGNKTSICIREEGGSMYYGWKFAKLNLQIIEDIKKGMFDESKYKI